MQKVLCSGAYGHGWGGGGGQDDPVTSKAPVQKKVMLTKTLLDRIEAELSLEDAISRWQDAMPYPEKS